MKIITFAAKKGGVGKTTLTYNYVGWLAKQGYKVLAIDLDNQCNLSSTYDVQDANTNVGNIFTLNENAPQVKIHHVSNNIDLIAGDVLIDVKEELIANRPNKNMLLFLWFAQHQELVSKYDYILIDTPPAFSTVTKNAIVVSHDIISPLTPDEYGYTAKFDLTIRFENFKKEAIDFNTMKSYVTSNLYFVANKLHRRETLTNAFLDQLKKDQAQGDNSVIDKIYYKAIFSKTTAERRTLSEMEDQKAIFTPNKDFFDEINHTFKNITSKL